MIRKKILVVDDELDMRMTLEIALKDDYEVFLAASGQEALEIIHEQPIDLVILDIKMPGMDGIEVLRKIKQVDPDFCVIMLTGVKDTRKVVTAMKLGASDYIIKANDIEALKVTIKNVLETQQLKKEVSYWRDQARSRYEADKIIGESPQIKSILKTVEKIKDTSSTVLIIGESGTGKELIARAIHYEGARADKPFVPIDCAALPESLLESELFGYEKGAFTGATQRKVGQFEFADLGTLFLDEIGEMDISIQSKILRALQEKEIKPLGGVKPIKIDVRLIAATNRDLEQHIAEGKFREDLYYRLNVLHIHIPPLRERKEDMLPLVEHFFKKHGKKIGTKVMSFSEEALNLLKQDDWPGNVRELEHLIERILTLSHHSVIEADELRYFMTRPSLMKGAGEKKEIASLEENLTQKIIQGNISLDNWTNELTNEMEKKAIEIALKETSGNQTEAAKLLNVSRSQLVYRMEKLGIKKR